MILAVEGGARGHRTPAARSRGRGRSGPSALTNCDGDLMNTGLDRPNGRHSRERRNQAMLPVISIQGRTTMNHAMRFVSTIERGRQGQPSKPIGTNESGVSDQWEAQCGCVHNVLRSCASSSVILPS